MQEYMLRNFQKKPTQNSAQLVDGEIDGSGFNIKRASKSTNNRAPSMAQDMEREDDDDMAMQFYRPKTPEIDEEILRSFDAKKQRITTLIKNMHESLDLSQESKPVREVLKANYGVSYMEEASGGGGETNFKLNGESYYMSPGRNMRRDELESRQVDERATKAKAYQKSRQDEFEL